MCGWAAVLHELPRQLLATSPGSLGLPYVTPHSARHAFISTLQAQGIEVGLVAKLAGHANATVTLAHYTQAVRGGEVAVEALERALRTTARGALRRLVCNRNGNRCALR